MEIQYIYDDSLHECFISTCEPNREYVQIEGDRVYMRIQWESS